MSHVLWVMIKWGDKKATRTQSNTCNKPTFFQTNLNYFVNKNQLKACEQGTLYPTCYMCMYMKYLILKYSVTLLVLQVTNQATDLSQVNGQFWLHIYDDKY